MKASARASLTTRESKTDQTRDSSSREDKPKLPAPINSSADQFSFLQRTIGNRGVERLLRSRMIQGKLKVNEPGDIYEQEADRIADQVLAAPTDATVGGAPPRIQRFTEQPTGQMDAAPASVYKALASPGRPLEPALQQDMEQRFGYDFSKARVHSGAAAEQSARDVKADAYTVGHDIVFGAGRFAPATQQGRRLIAHELTHVVQQSGSDGIRVEPSARSWMPAPLLSRNGFGRVAIQPTAGSMASKRVFRKEAGVEGAVQRATVAAFIANPPSATVTVTLSGMTVWMDERAKLVPGPSRRQLIAVTVKALVGSQYDPRLVEFFDKKIGSKGGVATGLLAEGAMEARGGDIPKGKVADKGPPASPRRR
jgi:hypothetical protein